MVTSEIHLLVSMSLNKGRGGGGRAGNLAAAGTKLETL